MTRPIPASAQLPADLCEAFERVHADASGAFGPTPFARLMVAHLVLFAELRRRGASWAQIAHLLSAHGIVGSDGAFTADVVRATYARAAKIAAATERKRSGRNATKHNEADRNAAKCNETQRSAAGRVEVNPDDLKPGDVKPDAAASDELARRAALSDKPWHT